MLAGDTMDRLRLMIERGGTVIKGQGDELKNARMRDRQTDRCETDMRVRARPLLIVITVATVRVTETRDGQSDI